jgi:MFS family permease
MLFVVASFLVTVFCWGIYGPVLHWGQAGMSTVPGEYARLLPFVCVGLAYFAIGVVVPLAWLRAKGEAGEWSTRGAVLSLAAGALGAIGALGIILAFNFGGKPSYVMPLVFGGAPVVNSFLTIYLARKMKEIGPLFLAGLVMVVLGAVTVLVFKPGEAKHAEKPAAVADAGDAGVESKKAEPEKKDGMILKQAKNASNFVLQMLSVATVIVCWGAYGPTLHKGQAAMSNSRMRPLLCVGLAYFLIAVVGSAAILGIWPENSHWTFWGAFWSLAAGAAGAIGALGIIMAFNFGGKPVYVMPLVFGGAPVVNTFFTIIIIAKDRLSEVQPLFLAGLILVIAGAAMVLIFAPKGAPPKKAAQKPAKPVEPAAPPAQ